MRTDIEIAQSVQGLAIEKIAEKINIPSSAMELYGKTKAKINLSELGDFEQKP
ncbi:MAG: formate--tetrahydrofolate ligase, partial [Erysipelotrichaceae bacterium]